MLRLGICEQIAASGQAEASANLPDATLIRRGVKDLGRRYDDEHGGFGDAPKFPEPANLELIRTRANYQTVMAQAEKFYAEVLGK